MKISTKFSSSMPDTYTDPSGSPRASSPDSSPDPATLTPVPRPILYLAGPMTGYPGYNYPAFTAAAAYLRSLGWTVISPHENGLPFGLDYETYMTKDWELFADAGAIALLPGWPYSTGARRELSWAVERGLPVYFLAPDARGLTVMAEGPPAQIQIREQEPDLVMATVGPSSPAAPDPV